MIVEDDEAIRESLRTALELEGYETVTASNGLEAIQWLRLHSDKPDLILLDLMMPIMDGWDFDKAMSEAPDTDQIPVIVVTAFSGELLSIKHAKKVIRKPVNLELLIEAVAEHCR